MVTELELLQTEVYADTDTLVESGTQIRTKSNAAHISDGSNRWVRRLKKGKVFINKLLIMRQSAFRIGIHRPLTSEHASG